MRPLPLGVRPLEIRDEPAVRAALHRLPRFFSRDAATVHRREFPASADQIRQRAERILDHDLEIFGRSYQLGPVIEWHADPLTGARFDAESPAHEIDVCATGVDPKRCWEVQRCAHLFELAVAARLHRPLESILRLEVVSQIDSFLTQCRVGRGLAYASPLEVAVRCIHWLAAFELLGGASAFPESFVTRFGMRLHADACFLERNLEDGGVSPNNHLLGDLVGLYVLGLALTGLPGSRRFRRLGQRRLLAECTRQVGSDGAHFEASTGYHRFALELLLVAHLWSRAAGENSGFDTTLHRMFRYLRGYLMPDGCEPAIGDGDDARVLPLVPRRPQQQEHLLCIGALLFSDPRLRRPQTVFCEEALWLLGSRSRKSPSQTREHVAVAWQALSSTPDLPSEVHLSGGVHVLRSDDLYVGFRSGSYGQEGVGGHAHNDQLSLVVHSDGKPLIIDAGTGSYGADPVLRDHFRSTAAHSTVLVDGEEQSPILPDRPFALFDRARAGRVVLEELYAEATLCGRHRGYDRLPGRVRHVRRLRLHRSQRVLIITDELVGHGPANVELRFFSSEPLRPGLSFGLAERLEETAAILGHFDLARAVELGVPARAALLVPIGSPLEPALRWGRHSPRFGSLAATGLVSFRARITLSAKLEVLLLLAQKEVA
jgi:hypothetical protein